MTSGVTFRLQGAVYGHQMSGPVTGSLTSWSRKRSYGYEGLILATGAIASARAAGHGGSGG